MYITKIDNIKKDLIDGIKDGLIKSYTEGFFIVKKDNSRYYYFNPKTKEEFGPYLDCGRFDNGFAIVTKVMGDVNLYQIIDTKGNVVKEFSAKYRNVTDFSDGYAKIGIKTFIDTTGKITEYKPNDKKVSYVSPFKNGRAYVEYEILGKTYYYFIDKNFNEIKKYIYDVVADYNEDRAVVGKRKKRFIVDKEENVIFESDLSLKNLKNGITRISSKYSNDLLSFSKNGFWGYLDKDGKVAIEPQFKSDVKFSDGVAIHNINGNIYIIDKQGNKKILLTEEQSKKYSSISDFVNGYALLHYNKLLPTSDIIDKDGNIIEFNELIKLYADYVVLEDCQHFIKLDNLKKLEKEYLIRIVTPDDKEIIRTFDSEEKRDNYFEMLEEEIKKATELSNNVYNEYLYKMLEESDDRYSKFCTEKGKAYIKERKEK